MIQRTYVFVDNHVPLRLQDGTIYEVFAPMFIDIIEKPANVMVDTANGFLVFDIVTLEDYQDVGGTTTFVTTSQLAREQDKLSEYGFVVNLLNHDYNKTYTIEQINEYNAKYDQMLEESKGELVQ